MTLFVVQHPHLPKGFIISTKFKVKDFIEKNDKIWKKHNMDKKLFTVEEFSVKDTLLEETIKDGMPELFL